MNAADWTFFGPESGGPSHVNGVTADEAGNVWVAGGEEGLFLLPTGSTQFRRFTLADGLHPYGYLDGGVPSTNTPYLNAISVAGGPGASVYVGYMGKPPDAGELSCEDNWDVNPPGVPDPDIYKSGDADHVTLSSTGISVVHYDIYTGPQPGFTVEPRGREKLCNILTIRYDPGNNSVWFGGNHGFAWGDATFAGDPTCYGVWGCSGLLEHSHPGFNAYCSDTSEDCENFETEDYHGVAIDTATHDVWFGGANRSTLFEFGTLGNFWDAQHLTETPAQAGSPSDHIDVWPDAVPEWETPHPSQLQPMDNVSSMAAMPDGTVWVASYAWGLAHVSKGGPLGFTIDAYVKDQLAAANVSTIAYDPLNGSLWIGFPYIGGLNRMLGGQIQYLGATVFGTALSQNPVSDIQIVQSGVGRRVLVGFQAGPQAPAGIGIYNGP